MTRRVGRMLFTFRIMVWRFDMNTLLLNIINRIFGEIWLISERGYDAEDNGYVFFAYMRKKHPKERVFYLINKRNLAAYNRVKKLGRTVAPNSIGHIIIYLLASKLVSAQLFNDVPELVLANRTVFYHFNRPKVTCFLQHGVIKDNINCFYNKKWVEKRGYDLNIFVCSADRECEYVAKAFGYQAKVVQNIGLVRFDLLRNKLPKQQILVMPTWRKYFEHYSLSNIKKNQEMFKKEEYFIRYQGLLNSKELSAILRENNVTLVFFPHNNMQEFNLNIFSSSSKNVIIANQKEHNIQKLIRDSSLLITDMSSVFMDFAYMERPIIYYHFDYEKYRRRHFPEGYFSYTQDGFGSIVNEEEDLINKIEFYVDNNFLNEEQYIEKSRVFFGNKEVNHCETTYYQILNYNN